MTTPNPAPMPIDPFPHLHVRPARGWVNDPNGIGYWDGRWHVMYQWNPAAPVHGDIHWGHMSSPDMLSWRDEGVALRPRPGGIDAAGVWSGVAVPDAGGVALVYTAVPDHAGHAVVAVARPDGHGGWVQPDRAATVNPSDDTWSDVRDPFVVSVAGRRLGILGAGRAADPRRPRRGAVLVYDADDLDDWRLLGTLLAAEELPDGMVGAGAIWECPQLVPIGDRWLLVVSWDDGAEANDPGPDGTPGRRLGVTAFVGDLDAAGTVPHFTALTETALDHGPDFYAPQLVADGERVLAWGWSWEGRGTRTKGRSDSDVAASGWAGTVTFPREVVIGPSGSALCVPARELAGLCGERIEVRSVGDGEEMQTSAASWMLTAGDAVHVDLLDVSTGRARPVWDGAGHSEVRIFTDGSIVEVFSGAGSTTLRAAPRNGEAWRVRSAGPMSAVVLRAPERAGRHTPV